MLGAIFAALSGIKAMTPDTAVRKGVDAVIDYLNKDERAAKMVADEIDKARQHDSSITATAGAGVKALHSSVRPIITYTAMAYYVYARLNGIELSDPDVYLIGGIIAFWFGVRPFEKHLRK